MSLGLGKRAPFRSQHSAVHADSQRHGAGCELLVVEGESAARSVAAIRHAPTQAVLPLQGKPLNAWKARAEKVAASPLYAQLAHALGLASAAADASPCAAAGEGAQQAARFERLVLLFDPDADGIHIGALVLLYLQRWQPAWLAQQRVWMVRAPMHTLQTVDGNTGEILLHHAYSPEHLLALKARLAQEGTAIRQQTSYRGLGSLPPDVLRDTCVEPRTRHAHAVTPQDVAAVVEVFGGAA